MNHEPDPRIAAEQFLHSPDSRRLFARMREDYFRETLTPELRAGGIKLSHNQPQVGDETLDAAISRFLDATDIRTVHAVRREVRRQFVRPAH